MERRQRRDFSGARLPQESTTSTPLLLTYPDRSSTEGYPGTASTMKSSLLMSGSSAVSPEPAAPPVEGTSKNTKTKKKKQKRYKTFKIVQNKINERCDPDLRGLGQRPRPPWRTR